MKIIRQKKSSQVITNFLLNKRIAECMRVIINGTILMKLYWNLSTHVLPTNWENDRNEIEKSESSQGELGNTSKLSRITCSQYILMNRIPD